MSYIVYYRLIWFFYFISRLVHFLLAFTLFEKKKTKNKTARCQFITFHCRVIRIVKGNLYFRVLNVINDEEKKKHTHTHSPTTLGKKNDEKLRFKYVWPFFPTLMRYLSSLFFLFFHVVLQMCVPACLWFFFRSLLAINMAISEKNAENSHRHLNETKKIWTFIQCRLKWNRNKIQQAQHVRSI